MNKVSLFVYIYATSVLWLSVGFFAIAQDLTLNMDQECEKISRYQVLATSAFWKISLKKDVNLAVSIREVGKRSLDPLCVLCLKLKDSPEYLAISRHDHGNEQMLHFTVYTINSIGSSCGASVDSNVVVDYLSVPKLIQISDSSEGYIMLHPSTDREDSFSLSENGQTVKTDSSLLSPSNKSRKKYELILQSVKRDYIEKYEKRPNTEIRSSSP